MHTKLATGFGLLLFIVLQNEISFADPPGEAKLQVRIDGQDSVAAFEIATGKIVWKAAIGGPILSISQQEKTVTVNHGATPTTSVLDLATGKLLEQRKT